jgi:hypothetical protein
MFDLPPRGIIHEHEFEEQLARLIPDPKQADEFIAAAQTVLSNDPKSGTQCKPGGSMWLFAMAPVGNHPVALYYSFDEETVVFVAILPFDD